MMSGPRLAGNSSYTLSVIDFPINYDIEIGVIEDHADAAIQHLGEHIEWKGVLDFVVKYDKNLEEAWDPNGPGFYSYDTHTGDKTVAPKSRQQLGQMLTTMNTIWDLGLVHSTIPLEVMATQRT